MNGTIGEVRMFGGTFAPRTWAFCDGQLLSIAQNTALFSILGTTYGGDGRTTFGLPDLRGRAPLSAGTGAGLHTRNLGARGGAETETITLNQLAAHTHFTTVGADTFPVTGTATATMNVSADSESEEPYKNLLSVSDGITKYASTPSGTLNPYSVFVDTSMLSVNAGGITVTNTNTGGSQAHNNMQPYLVVHYIICLQGIFPSRN